MEGEVLDELAARIGTKRIELAQRTLEGGSSQSYMAKRILEVVEKAVIDDDHDFIARLLLHIDENDMYVCGVSVAKLVGIHESPETARKIAELWNYENWNEVVASALNVGSRKVLDTVWDIANGIKDVHHLALLEAVATSKANRQTVRETADWLERKFPIGNYHIRPALQTSLSAGNREFSEWLSERGKHYEDRVTCERFLTQLGSDHVWNAFLPICTIDYLKWALAKVRDATLFSCCRYRHYRANLPRDPIEYLPAALRNTEHPKVAITLITSLGITPYHKGDYKPILLACAHDRLDVLQWFEDNTEFDPTDDPKRYFQTDELLSCEILEWFRRRGVDMIKHAFNQYEVAIKKGAYGNVSWFVSFCNLDMNATDENARWGTTIRRNDLGITGIFSYLRRITYADTTLIALSYAQSSVGNDGMLRTLRYLKSLGVDINSVRNWTYVNGPAVLKRAYTFLSHGRDYRSSQMDREMFLGRTPTIVRVVALKRFGRMMWRRLHYLELLREDPAYVISV